MKSYYISSCYFSIICVFLFYSLLNSSCNSASTRPNYSSTKTSDINTNTETNNLSYKGYRLELVNVQVKEEKGDQLRITGTLINTGREKIILPSKGKSNILLTADKTFQENGLLPYTNTIRKAILKQKTRLEPGQIASNISIKIKKDKDLVIPSTKEDLFTKGGDELEIDACPDLIIDTFFVAKRTKKYVDLRFKIINIGTGPASLFGATKAVEDNVAIRAYASGTAKLSRGDLVMGGAFIEGGLKDKNGILHPNETFGGDFRVDIRKKTRHMPYIIISIDDYQNLWECDEGNNVKRIVYR